MYLFVRFCRRGSGGPWCWRGGRRLGCGDPADDVAVPAGGDDPAAAGAVRAIASLRAALVPLVVIVCWLGAIAPSRTATT